jgi:hypothetical protein
MHSYRVLGIIALGAIVIAVVSFTVVDISIDSVNGCLAAPRCVQREVPGTAILFSAVGCLALLIAIVPAIGWITGMLRRPLPAEPHPPRVPRSADPAAAAFEDEP